MGLLYYNFEIHKASFEKIKMRIVYFKNVDNISGRTKKESKSCKMRQREYIFIFVCVNLMIITWKTNVLKLFCHFGCSIV